VQSCVAGAERLSAEQYAESKVVPFGEGSARPHHFNQLRLYPSGRPDNICQSAQRW
jgi:hypothetical protein